MLYTYAEHSMCAADRPIRYNPDTDTSSRVLGESVVCPTVCGRAGLVADSIPYYKYMYNENIIV
jgi:hypothetical protein